MNPFEQHREALDLAQATLPDRSDSEPLFRTPWHARIFALIVALVKNEEIPWKSFQEKLVSTLKQHQSADVQLTAEEIDLQYFECWLLAAEETLLEAGFVETSQVARQIEAIRTSVVQTRADQLTS
ncbi:nitrile hydratase accessory protein [Denitrobaculum tricleocarpae]|uniref:nitrile hydratase accessory protein n=1 Tax=Denitrobaculum tricleocarpae TaxID=2591009 RepID=UPI0015D16114|nr:nitrile hydratase accessory protein [Denitrobaculum tricleocarpae]